MRGTILKGVYLHAAAFREAIIVSNGGDLLGLQDFPRGACGDTSTLLGQFLFDMGFGEWTYVVGERSAASGQESHAWIEKEELIVDITASQFPEISDPVVVTANDAWHSQFRDQTRHVAFIDVYDDRTREKLANAYEKILSSIVCVGPEL